MTTIQAAREQQQETKARIIELLKWDEMQYATMQYNMGLHYLVMYLLEHDDSIRMMERSRLFWAWWKTQWALRDQEFIAMCEAVGSARLSTQPIYSLRSRLNDYYTHHDARHLVHQIAPARVITYQIKKEMLLW
jgi:hypothetical protein